MNTTTTINTLEKAIIPRSTHSKFMVLLSIVAIFGVFITFSFAIELSSFAIALAKAGMGIILFWLMDSFMMKQIDTVGQLKKGNIAYGLFLLSLAVVIGCAIIAS